MYLILNRNRAPLIFWSLIWLGVGYTIYTFACGPWSPTDLCEEVEPALDALVHDVGLGATGADSLGRDSREKILA